MYSKEWIRLTAKACHQNNKAYCEMIGDNSQVDWDKAPEEIQQSAIDGVGFHLSGERQASSSHENWCEHKHKHGWRYGPVKDAELKTHPCMVPYDQLPLEQQIKDLLFKLTVDTMKLAQEAEQGSVGP